MRQEKRLLLLAFFSEVCYLTLYFFSRSNNGGYISIALSCFLLYGIALKGLSRDGETTNLRRYYGIILGSSLIFRATLFALPPFTSDDIYRYIWDGHVQAAGINPYRYAPNADELLFLRESQIHPFINHPHLPTIYPPLAQVCFLVAYYGGNGSVWGFKILSFFAETISCLLLITLLKELKILSPFRMLLYGWCPLLVLEFFTSGHVDVLGIPFLLLFILSMVKAHQRVAALALAAAVLVKILPIILLPLIARQLGWRKMLDFMLFFSLTIIVGYLPYASAGWNVMGSLNTYLTHWSFNSSCFALLGWLSGSDQIAHQLAYLAIAIWTITIAFTQRDLLAGICWTLTGVYLFSPTVFPWYLSWVVPVLAIFPLRALLVLLMLCSLSYWPGDRAAIRILEYLPFFLLLIYDLIKDSPAIETSSGIRHKFLRSDYDDS